MDVTTPIDRLQYNASLKQFTGEISSTNGLYSGPGGAELKVRGAGGSVKTFAVERSVRDAEGELTHWELRSTDNEYTMVLFND